MPRPTRPSHKPPHSDTATVKVASGFNFFVQARAPGKPRHLFRRFTHPCGSFGSCDFLSYPLVGNVDLPYLAAEGPPSTVQSSQIEGEQSETCLSWNKPHWLELIAVDI